MGFTEKTAKRRRQDLCQPVTPLFLGVNSDTGNECCPSGRMGLAPRFLRFPNSGTFLCLALTLHHDGGFMSAAACIFRAVWAPRARSARSRRCKYQVLPAARVSGGCGQGGGPALALGAEPRGLGPCEAEPPRPREPGDASCWGVLHEASMRALRAAAYVKKRRNCSLAGGGDVSTHGRGSPAVAEGQDDSVPSPR